MASADEVKETLGEVITKPKLSDKILGKPPFRFLHDVISEVIKVTGFGEGLYEGDELNAKEISGKEAKVAYLNKIILCTGIALGSPVDINPNKVVAGKEVERTCGWLVSLAKAATSGADFNQCVHLTLSGDVPGSLDRGGGEEKAMDADGETKAAAAEDEERHMREEREVDRKRIDDIKKREQEKNMKQEEEEEEIRKATARAAREVARPSGASRTAPPRSSPIPTGPGDTLGELDLSRCNGDVEITKEFVGSLISKPKMQDKLLDRPPYRFLLDCVVAIFETSGFGQGLFEEVELSPKVSKEEKLNFLTKVINCTYHFMGLIPEVKAVKVISGKEAELTNMFLQHLAVAASRCQMGGNSSTAVVQTLAGEVPNGRDARGGIATASETKSEEPKFTPVASESKSEEPPTIVPTPSQHKPDPRVSNNNSFPLAAAESKFDDHPQPSDPTTNDTEIESSAPVRRVERPKTARKRPPKLKDNNNEESKVAGGGGGGGGGSKSTAAPIGIFVDGKDDMSDSDDEGNVGVAGPGVRANLNDGNETHSKLVQNILNEEKKNDDGVVGEANNGAKANGNESDNNKSNQGGIRMGKIRKTKSNGSSHGGAAPVELGELRLSIQKLCQSTNPLGKCMDYVHDDMETMGRELEQWKMVYRQKCDILEEEVRKSEEQLQPFQSKLLDADEKIRDQVQKMNSVKSRIAKNEVRIAELLKFVVSTSS